MAARYFLESAPHDQTALVVGSEAHHLLHVMRARAGEEVVLFDGSGWEYQARIERLGRTEVQCQIFAREEIDRELARPIVLGVALPKGDRQQWLLEKAVELGVARLTPLETERSVAQPSDNALVRLRRTVIEASKQCGRNRLMEIAAPQSWPEFLAADVRGALRLLAHPGGDELATFNGQAALASGFCFAVGPEGGLTAAEVQAAQAASFHMTGLGPRILRIETACLLLASWASLIAESPSKSTG